MENSNFFVQCGYPGCNNAATVDYSAVEGDNVALELSVAMCRCHKFDLRASRGASQR
jgi:hypothetical protein